MVALALMMAIVVRVVRVCSALASLGELLHADLLPLTTHTDLGSLLDDRERLLPVEESTTRHSEQPR
jgi:hypothetical protein